MFCSLFETVKPSPILTIDVSHWTGFPAQMSLVRDELNHAIVSGNKLRKLKYPLSQALKSGVKGITSFGGAHSNHAHALAYACQELGLECHLIIRGEEASPATSATLADCVSWQARIEPVTRAEYRKRHDAAQQQVWLKPGHLLLPEGGSAAAALPGVGELLDARTAGYRFIATAVGSGGTAAGLAGALTGKQKLLAVPAVRDSSLPERVAQLMTNPSPKICWVTGYEWGGFAKLPTKLQRFAADFFRRTNVLLDPVYTCKLAYALVSEIAAKRLPADGSVLMYHSGGLQGWRGMTSRQLIPEMQDCLAMLH